MRTTRLLIPALLLGLASAAEPPPPTFSKKPTTTRAGDKVKIDFAVDRDTDVAVYIENAKNQIVRHLVAGLLGPKAPAPLVPGLAQSLEWDGLDDAGRAARSSAASGGGGFRVRVGLGLSAAWAGTAFGSEARPDNLTGVSGLACAPDEQPGAGSRPEGRQVPGHAGLAVTDRHADVAHCGNRRVLRMKLGHAAEETVPAP